ncbi:hypothetical protein ANN_27648 [Periplaneta americana]|uniref:Gastrula zinc finger protein XlCGF57.1-like n=1 Tax=Periplaneta americana TaxID=6978 RepID=A0ABQ8RWG7_PERAM|nr:hypothetical protein ANN_27648 [Periplaneta americana]
MELLDICLKTTYFVFNNRLFQQNEGMAMGSPLSSLISNIYMEYFEELALSTASHKPTLWLRYVDDTFIIWPHIMMAAIKTEAEDDVLAVQSFDDTDMEEAIPSADVNEAHLQNPLACWTTVPSMDPSCDLKSEIKMEETEEPVTFPVVKCESEKERFHEVTEENGIKLEVKEEEYEDSSESISNSNNYQIPNVNDTFPEYSGSSLSFASGRTADDDPLKCGNFFSTSSELRIHVSGPSYEKSLKCAICGKFFSRKRNLDVHLRTHTGVKPFQCDMCGKYFSDYVNLKVHLRYHLGVKPFKCDFCGKAFVESGNFRVHVRTHTGEKPFKCDICGKSFSRKFILEVHLRTHTKEKPFKCDSCGKFFSGSENFKLHVRSHMLEKPFICHFCGKSFIRSGNFRQHLRTHTDDKPFKCCTCGKLFSRRSTLNMHLRTHTGDKPFKCDICGKYFSESGNLKVHIRTHTGEKPFKCDTCEKSFATSGSLSVHIHTHLGEKRLKCAYCGKFFATLSTLKVHERTHMNLKPFECDVCGKCFTMKGSLRIHVRGSELVQHYVSVAHRIPSRPGKTRPIVIRFTKSRSRDEWLQLFRNEAKNDGSGPGIATKKVNRDLPAGRITAGDQLTAVTRDLLNKTRLQEKMKPVPVQTTATMTTLSIPNDWLASNYTRTHRHTASQSSQWTGQKRRGGTCKNVLCTTRQYLCSLL